MTTMRCRGHGGACEDPEVGGPRTPTPLGMCAWTRRTSTRACGVTVDTATEVANAFTSWTRPPCAACGPSVRVHPDRGVKRRRGTQGTSARRLLVNLDQRQQQQDAPAAIRSVLHRRTYGGLGFVDQDSTPGSATTTWMILPPSRSHFSRDRRRGRDVHRTRGVLSPRLFRVVAKMMIRVIFISEFVEWNVHSLVAADMIKPEMTEANAQRWKRNQSHYLHQNDSQQLQQPFGGLHLRLSRGLLSRVADPFPVPTRDSEPQRTLADNRDNNNNDNDNHHSRDDDKDHHDDGHDSRDDGVNNAWNQKHSYRTHSNYNFYEESRSGKKRNIWSRWYPFKASINASNGEPISTHLRDVWLCLFVALGWTTWMISSFIRSDLVRYQRESILVRGHVLQVVVEDNDRLGTGIPTYKAIIDYMVRVNTDELPLVINHPNENDNDGLMTRSTSSSSFQARKLANATRRFVCGGVGTSDPLDPFADPTSVTTVQIRKQFETQNVRLVEGFANVDILVLPHDPTQSILRVDWEKEVEEQAKHLSSFWRTAWCKRLTVILAAALVLMSLIAAIQVVTCLSFETRIFGWILVCVGVIFLFPTALLTHRFIVYLYNALDHASEGKAGKIINQTATIAQPTPTSAAGGNASNNADDPQALTECRGNYSVSPLSPVASLRQTSSGLPTRLRNDDKMVLGLCSLGSIMDCDQAFGAIDTGVFCSDPHEDLAEAAPSWVTTTNNNSFDPYYTAGGGVEDDGVHETSGCYVIRFPSVMGNHATRHPTVAFPAASASKTAALADVGGHTFSSRKLEALRAQAFASPSVTNPSFVHSNSLEDSDILDVEEEEENGSHQHQEVSDGLMRRTDTGDDGTDEKSSVSELSSLSGNSAGPVLGTLV